MYTVVYIYRILHKNVETFLDIQRQAAEIYKQYGALDDEIFAPVDLDAKYGCLAFTDVLELTEDDEGNSAVVKIGDLLINLLKISEAPELINPASVAAPEAGSRFVLTIPVDDVDALCETLRSRGVELLNGPMDRPWGPRTASFKDPAGYIWEIAN